MLGRPNNRTLFWWLAAPRCRTSSPRPGASGPPTLGPPRGWDARPSGTWERKWRVEIALSLSLSLPSVLALAWFWRISRTARHRETSIEAAAPPPRRSRWTARRPAWRSREKTIGPGWKKESPLKPHAYRGFHKCPNFSIRCHLHVIQLIPSSWGVSEAVTFIRVIHKARDHQLNHLVRTCKRNLSPPQDH